MTVAFDERQSEYAFEQLDELEHAYAITTHKAQGSEYEGVIIPVFAAPSRLLTRNLFYTAITRARRQLTLIGREEIIARMVSNYQTYRRYGALKTRLRREIDAL
jgi:exodeoxyribonuclease V alpha subunit